MSTVVIVLFLEHFLLCSICMLYMVKTMFFNEKVVGSQIFQKLIIVVVNNMLRYFVVWSWGMKSFKFLKSKCRLDWLYFNSFFVACYHFKSVYWSNNEGCVNRVACSWSCMNPEMIKEIICWVGRGCGCPSMVLLIQQWLGIFGDLCLEDYGVLFHWSQERRVNSLFIFLME